MFLYFENPSPQMNTCPMSGINVLKQCPQTLCSIFTVAFEQVLAHRNFENNFSIREIYLIFQQTFISSKSLIVTPKKGMEYVQS